MGTETAKMIALTTMPIKSRTIRLALLCAIVLLAPSLLMAQTTLVSATITDSGGVAWKNGTYQFTFEPSDVNPTAQYTQGGAPFNRFQTVPATGPGSLDNTGSFTSVVVPDNLTIFPAGSTWELQVCPAATASNGCFNVDLTITGATQNLTSSVIPPPIVVNLTNPQPAGASAYNDGEIIGARIGSTYYNLTDGTLHVCQIPVCTWQSIVSSATLLTTDNIFTNNNRFKGPIPWFDLTANGGVGDGSTDNTTAINNVLTSLNSDSGGWLLAPNGTGNTWKTGNWTIPSWTKWSQLHFWGTLSPTATIVLNHQMTALIGDGGGGNVDFQRMPSATLGNANPPMIQVNTGSAGGVYVRGWNAGFCSSYCAEVTGNSPNTTWENVWFQASGTNTAGPMHIANSFGHYFRDVGFSALSSSASAVSLDLTGPAGTGSTRMVYCDTCFFRGGTVNMGPTSAESGLIDQFVFFHPYWEGLTSGNSYFTINSTNANGKIDNVSVINPEFADPLGTNYMFCLTGTQFFGLTVIQPSPVSALFCPGSTAPSSAIFLNPGRDCSADNITAGLLCIGNKGSLGAQIWSTDPVHGSTYGYHVTSVSAASYTVKPQDGLILCTGSPNSPNITLPVPTGTATAGLVWTIEKVDATASCSITPGSGTIEGKASISLSAQYDYVTISADGANYEILSTNRFNTKTSVVLNAIEGIEGAGVGGGSGFDKMWPDSTAHRWKMNNNNVGADTVVGAATTDTLTNKTVNVPLTSGTGLQIFNTTTTCTTGASVGATCTTAAISLPVVEADTSYRVTCTGKGLTAVPVVIATANSSASQFTITIAALTAVAASFSSYDCVAGHN